MNSYNFLIHNINKQIARSLPYKGRVFDLGSGTAPYKEDILKVANEYMESIQSHDLKWGYN